MNRSIRKLIVAMMTVALVVASAIAATAGPNLKTTDTSLSASPNPVSVGGTVALEAEVTQKHGDQVLVSEGTVRFQYKVPSGSWTTISTVAVVSGAASAGLEVTAAILGEKKSIQFQALYLGGTNFDPSDSNKVSVGIGECEGFLITNSFASGDGSPAPGTEGAWQYRIEVRNCTGEDLEDVKVQGGSNGWQSGDSTPGIPTSGTTAVRSTKKNTITTWTLDIEDGATETLLIAFHARIPAKASCWDGVDESLEMNYAKYLSGNWSATWMGLVDDGEGGLVPGPIRVDQDPDLRPYLVVTCNA